MADNQKGATMDPQSVFCPNSDYPARGQRGRGNVQIHSQQERRYRCSLGQSALAQRVRAWALPSPLLLVTDGLAGYRTAFQRVVRSPQRDGQTGRPPLVAWPGVVIGPVVKQYQRRRAVGVTPRLVQGSAAEA